MIPKEEKLENYCDARIIARDYVCAKCFGRLITPILKEISPNTGKEYVGVQCINCGPGTGFVTATYAEHKKDESRRELSEARRNLATIMGIETKAIPIEDAKKIFNFNK